MKEDWLRTIEHFFAAKNRAWLTGDGEELGKWVDHSGVIDPFLEDIQALTRSAKDRNVSYKKSRTQLSVIDFDIDAQEKAGCVDVVEGNSWLYYDHDTLEDEQRRQPIRLHVRGDYGDWWITGIERLGERDRPGMRTVPISEIDHSLTSEMRGNYNRLQAYRYAELWWDRFNPAYQNMEVDCTNFVSQAMYAGGMPMSHMGNRSKGWWYMHAGGHRDNWSYSWAVANAQRWYLENPKVAKGVESPGDLKVGDTICYDWDGDGNWQHNTIVVDFDSSGMPLVNAHTIASRRRYWSYYDSHAWTENTKYRFFSIRDTF